MLLGRLEIGPLEVGNCKTPSGILHFNLLFLWVSHLLKSFTDIKDDDYKEYVVTCDCIIMFNFIFVEISQSNRKIK